MPATMKKEIVEKYPTLSDREKKGIAWSEDFKIDKSIFGRLTFAASSFQQWADKTLPQAANLKPTIEPYFEAIKDFVRVGDFVLYRLTLPTFILGRNFPFSTKTSWRRAEIAVTLSNKTTANVAFDDTVFIPVLAKIDDDRLMPWMSLTPNEIHSQRGMIRRAKGHTAIAGMGMGWMARKLLERDKVTKLTIVEQDSAVLSFFGNPFVAEFGDRVELVHADAYKHNWENYDVSLWDIWERIGDAAYDSRFKGLQQQLRAKGRVCEGWTCWSSL